MREREREQSIRRAGEGEGGESGERGERERRAEGGEWREKRREGEGVDHNR